MTEYAELIRAIAILLWPLCAMLVLALMVVRAFKVDDAEGRIAAHSARLARLEEFVLAADHSAATRTLPAAEPDQRDHGPPQAQLPPLE